MCGISWVIITEVIDNAMHCRRLLCQFFEPSCHKVIQSKADDPNRFDGLLRPRKDNLLCGASGIASFEHNREHAVLLLSNTLDPRSPEIM